MGRHIFVEDTQRLPIVGDLIRSINTMQFINIVLEVIPIDSYSCRVRSVRYGDTNSGSFKYLDGQRSRWVVYTIIPPKQRYTNTWHPVKEFIEFDNFVIREQIVYEMKNVYTSYVPEPDAPPSHLKEESND